MSKDDDHKVDIFRLIRLKRLDLLTKELNKRPLRVNEKTSDGFTLLMYAAKDGLVDFVDMLIERGAIIDAKNFAGLTAMIYASHNNHKGICGTLSMAIQKEVHSGDEKSPETL